MTNRDTKKPLAVVDIRNFQGLLSNADKHDLPPGGAVVQVNMQTVEEGTLTTRGGLKALRFDP